MSVDILLVLITNQQLVDIDVEIVPLMKWEKSFSECLLEFNIEKMLTLKYG